MQFGKDSDWMKALTQMREQSGGRNALGSKDLLDPKKGCIFGHEFVCEIVEIGDETAETKGFGDQTLKVGDRVVGVGKGGYSNRYPGGYAQYMIMAPQACVKVPGHLSDDEAALTEPMAVGLHAVRRGIAMKKG